MNPQFSLIVPVYNVEEYLGICVESILNQSFSDFELILVDDGSPDKCPQMCDEYAKKDARIKVVHKKNGGSTSARKAGLKTASGKYIIVIDSDDWVAEKLLEHLNEVIENSHSDVICFNYYLAKGELELIKHKYAEGLYTGIGLENIKQNYLYDLEMPGLNGGTLPCSMCLKAVKKYLYDECLYLVPDDIAKGEDLLFCLYLLEKCEAVFMIDYAGYYYRFNESSISHTYNRNDIAKLHRVTELILQADTANRLVYRNKAHVYSFITFWNLIIGYGEQVQSKSEFIDYMKKEYHADFDRYYNDIHLATYTLKDRLKMMLVRKHMWSVIYMYANRHK